ncbi:Orn/DAP/Arg decarboxylase 2 C-terminal [Penicillium frequentans]|uniref:Orn/DAP/Arg decarboxylase 2 C-terminal n=1 Tax=Penicillium frequentans TaxID=3151616 RepID=A0AAD6CJ42_9EURO|nr:Orn/DAP/Arg decarboxylase 2 C-terminal [Penicillium glabrum]
MDLLPFPSSVPVQREIGHAERPVGDLEYTKPTPDELIDLAIQRNITRINTRGLVGGDEAFYIADLAIKCNSDPMLLKCLADHGTGFDCASIEEMRTVLNLGVDPARILFANPCKAAASLVFAREAGVLRTTFDNIDELDTIKTHMPEAQLLLRIYANDDSALISFGEKFGAPLDTTQALLVRARELGFDVVGVSFHVGTGAKSPTAFSKAIQHARQVFTQASNLGFTPSILDIGGGFEDSSFESISSHILQSIRTEFPAGVTAIAEPGRFYARSAYTLVSRVVARRRQMGVAAVQGVPDMLYQNDGVYGSFMNVVMEKEVMLPVLVRKRGKSKGNKKYRYSVWGPTCDGIDCVAKEARFGEEVMIGDWLKYMNMGAYTSTTATKFNGFNTSLETFYVNSETMPGF